MENIISRIVQTFTLNTLELLIRINDAVIKGTSLGVEDCLQTQTRIQIQAGAISPAAKLASVLLVDVDTVPEWEKLTNCRREGSVVVEYRSSQGYATFRDRVRAACQGLSGGVGRIGWIMSGVGPVYIKEGKFHASAQIFGDGRSFLWTDLLEAGSRANLEVARPMHFLGSLMGHDSKHIDILGFGLSDNAVVKSVRSSVAVNGITLSGSVSDSASNQATWGAYLNLSKLEAAAMGPWASNKHIQRFHVTAQGLSTIASVGCVHGDATLAAERGIVTKYGVVHAGGLLELDTEGLPGMFRDARDGQHPAFVPADNTMDLIPLAFGTEAEAAATLTEFQTLFAADGIHGSFGCGEAGWVWKDHFTELQHLIPQTL